MYQQALPISNFDHAISSDEYRSKLIELLSYDLDFHDEGSKYSSHNFHSFPAKFPPQLPKKFIAALTNPGDTILDPMTGSGTTVLEAVLLGRKGVGFDIDPLALKISQVKTTPLDIQEVTELGERILSQARVVVSEKSSILANKLNQRWDEETKNFIDYWFAYDTQIQLMALIEEISKVDNEQYRAFFELIFSAIIITKNGGVSLAFDLAHTRPHRAKVVMDRSGKCIIGGDLDTTSKRVKILTKTLRSPLEEFEKRLWQNVKGLRGDVESNLIPSISFGNAQNIPLDNSSVDLIVTSSPYASNAIDYMRAHKFALVWFGYLVDDLSQKRKEYIGGEAFSTQDFEDIPEPVAAIVLDITRKDRKKGLVLHRYYSEMTRVLREMFRVLRPGKASIVVVGSSIMRDTDTETAECLASIGQRIGFEVPKIGIRNLDRDRRMLPVGANRNLASQIQQRMHEEYVIGFYKPE